MNNNYQNWSKVELIKEIKWIKSRKKYGLGWEDKPEINLKKFQKA